MAEKMDDQPPLEDTVEKMDDQPPPGAMTEKMNDQQPLGGMAEKMDDQPLPGAMAEKMDDQPLQPVPSPRDTNSHPQQMGGGAVAVRRVVGGQGAEAVQPVYHSPSLEDKEMLQTSVEESLMPSPATSQMVVTVKRE